VGKPKATQAEINKILKKTNIYNFIQTLPGKLDYHIGQGGSRLSGGQKQRIAIARALIK
jgi:ABC-type multidrug transport system fused ATPase/permease subunit